MSFLLSPSVSFGCRRGRTTSVQVTHVNNKEDIIPILPGKFLGFHHPSGEFHIQDSNAWLSCPGTS